VSPQTCRRSISTASKGSARTFLITVDPEQKPGIVLATEHFQGALQRIEQPGVLDAAAGIDRQLARPVVTTGRGGEDLANPVRWHLEGSFAGSLVALFTPAGKVGDQDLRIELNPRLVQDDPASRTVDPAAERRNEEGSKLGRCPDMWRVRPRVDDQLTIDDLADHVFRKVVEIGDCRGTMRVMEARGFHEDHDSRSLA
jgi:hypothetical protein